MYVLSACILNKLLPMNCARPIELLLDDELMEVVDDHVYLGSIISSNGQRVKDMQGRIKKTKSVANEIVQICKETELWKICLRYVKLLLTLCLDSTVKYGCALWDLCKSKKSVDDLIDSNQMQSKESYSFRHQLHLTQCSMTLALMTYPLT